MSVSINPTQTLENVRQWPIEHRLELVFGLWDQIVEDGWKPELTDEMKDELDRRLAKHEADPDNVRTWEQILARVRKKS